MRVGIIQASSQTSKNQILYALTQKAAVRDEIINFGCFENEPEKYSYVEISIEIGLLLASNAVDFIVTGCSSGQGMMLACNNFPGVLCGYAPTAQDAFLFGRINAGNAISVPLGLNYGWAGELNLRYTLSALFEQPFGIGYPAEEAAKKMEDTEMLNSIQLLSKIPMVDLLDRLNKDLVNRALNRQNVVSYVLNYGKKQDILRWIKNRCGGCSAC